MPPHTMQILWLEGPRQCGKISSFLASFPGCGGNPASFCGNPASAVAVTKGAELGDAAPSPEVCSRSRAGSDHSHPLTSQFLFSSLFLQSFHALNRILEPAPARASGDGTGITGLRAALRGLHRRPHLPGSDSLAALIGRFWATSPPPGSAGSSAQRKVFWAGGS